MQPDRAPPHLLLPRSAGKALDSELEEGESTNPNTYPSTETGQLQR